MHEHIDICQLSPERIRNEYPQHSTTMPLCCSSCSHVGDEACNMQTKAWTEVFPNTPNKPPKRDLVTSTRPNTVDFKRLEQVRRMICAGVPSLFGLGLEEGHAPTVCLLLQCLKNPPHSP